MGSKAKRSTPAPAGNRGIKSTIGYTLRTVPRTTWDCFRKRLDGEGRTVNWALNQFITEYGDHGISLKVE